MRRQLTVDDIEALAEGSAVLGTGGGGDPYLGAIFAQQVLKATITIPTGGPCVNRH